MSRIISFRGLLEDGGIDMLPLQTNNGLIGYKIVKFQGVPKQPMTLDQENVIKIYKTEQTTADGNVDFSDNRLLGVCCVSYDNDAATPAIGQSVIFDNEIFNQDIYITHEDVHAGNRPCNYYIELEQMKLDLSEQTVTTLKDIRNTGTQ